MSELSADRDSGQDNQIFDFNFKSYSVCFVTVALAYLKFLKMSGFVTVF